MTLKFLSVACALVMLITLLPVAQAGVDDATADVFSLGTHGRKRKKARAKERAERAKIQARAAADLRLAEVKRVEDLLVQLKDEEAFLNGLKAKIPVITDYQNQLVDYARVSQGVMHRIYTNLKGALNANEGGNTGLKMITKAFAQGQSGGTKEALNGWDKAVDKISRFAEKDHKTVEVLIRESIDQANQVDRDAFVSVVSSLRTLLLALFHEIEGRLTQVEGQRDGLEKQLAALNT